ncbi:rod-determining factor RdfA [Halobacteriales archaeon Cl-PHB]
MGESTDQRQTKIERVVDEYDLQGIEATLAERWTGEGRDRWSLRDLADYFNERVLQAALERAGRQPLDGEVTNYYRLLTDDGVSAGARTEARDELERTGVDVDALPDDFVSHQAVHTFLTKRQDLTYETTSDEDRVEKVRESLRRLEQRTESVAVNSLTRLRDTGDLDLENFSVLVSASVVCEDCGRQHDVEDLLDQGGCDCQQ